MPFSAANPIAHSLVTKLPNKPDMTFLCGRHTISPVIVDGSSEYKIDKLGERIATAGTSEIPTVSPAIGQFVFHYKGKSVKFGPVVAFQRQHFGEGCTKRYNSATRYIQVFLSIENEVPVPSHSGRITSMSDSSLKKDLWRIIGVICALSVLSVAAVLILTEQALARQSGEILGQKMNTAGTLAGKLQFSFEQATKVLKIASESTEFEIVNNADSVSEDYNGIPIGLEEGKRKVLRDLRDNYETFDTITFMLPNGDVYILEPYSRQLSLPRFNYADREYYQGAIATGKPYAADVIISTASMQRIATIAVPIYSSDGQLTGLIVGATDLGQLEDAFRKELVLSNNNRIIYVDSKGNAIQDVSEEKSETYTTIKSYAYLQSVQNVITGNSGNIVEEVDGQETLTVYQPAIVSDRQWGVVLMQPTADAYASINYSRNQVYVMLAIIVSIIAVSGYFFVSFRTHSTLSKQLGKANTELVEKDKLKDAFLKIASHELRTPIQPIIGYASLGARGLIKDNEAWKVVLKESKRLMNLANNIVDISMVQSGVIRYNMENIDIAAIVRKAVESCKPMVQEKKLSLELDVSEKFENVEINADSVRILGVFGELLDNAIKFTEKGGIRVECTTDGTRLLVRISDSGSAIPAELLPKIFDKFSSTSVDDAKIQGAGLGLYICKAILTAHGGTIEARNNADGVGAVFEVTLPLQSQVDARTPTAAIS